MWAEQSHFLQQQAVSREGVSWEPSAATIPNTWGAVCLYHDGRKRAAPHSTHQDRCQIFMAQMNKCALVLCHRWKRESREIQFMPSESFPISCSVMSNSLQPHEQQHTRLPYPSLTPGACSNSCPSSQWCHPIVSSSAVPFSSCFQSFPASGSFLMSMKRGAITLCHMQRTNWLWILNFSPKTIKHTLSPPENYLYFYKSF